MHGKHRIYRVIPVVAGLALGMAIYHGAKAALPGGEVISGDQLVAWEEPLPPQNVVRIAQMPSVDTAVTPDNLDEKLRQQHKQLLEEREIRKKEVLDQLKEDRKRRSVIDEIGRYQFHVEVMQGTETRPGPTLYAFKMDTTTGKMWVSKSDMNGDLPGWKEIAE